MIPWVHIEQAGIADAGEILDLQKLAYQSEAVLYNDFNIPPLKQTLPAMEEELRTQVVLKACTPQGRIIGSVRGCAQEGTCFVGKLIVHPESQGQGLGTYLIQEIERWFPEVQRFELFTGHLSARNLHIYQKCGYQTFREEVVSQRLTLRYMEKRNPSVSHQPL